MANRNFSSNKLYQFENYPVLLACNFIVDSTNGNGFGIRSLKGGGVLDVFMHTSSTPGRTKFGLLNPNPAAGVIMVRLQDNYNRYLSGFSGQVSPVSGTPLTSTTQHTAYTIVSLGTATLAQWVAAGLPVGITPAVGATFIAIATGTIGGSAAVEVVAAAGSAIDHIEIMGDPNATLTVANSPVNGGGMIIMNCFEAHVVAAPADGSTVGLNFYLSNSSNTIKGQ